MRNLSIGVAAMAAFAPLLGPGSWAADAGYYRILSTQQTGITERVPLPDEPPAHSVCIHNLLLIHRAKECAREKCGLDYGDYVTVDQLMSCGLDLMACQCPRPRSPLVAGLLSGRPASGIHSVPRFCYQS